MVSTSRPQYGTQYQLAMWPGTLAWVPAPFGKVVQSSGRNVVPETTAPWAGSQEGNPGRHQVRVSYAVLLEKRDKSGACRSRILTLETISSDTIVLLSRTLHLINENLVCERCLRKHLAVPSFMP